MLVDRRVATSQYLRVMLMRLSFIGPSLGFASSNVASLHCASDVGSSSSSFYLPSNNSGLFSSSFNLAGNKTCNLFLVGTDPSPGLVRQTDGSLLPSIS